MIGNKKQKYSTVGVLCLIPLVTLLFYYKIMNNDNNTFEKKQKKTFEVSNFI